MFSISLLYPRSLIPPLHYQPEHLDYPDDGSSSGQWESSTSQSGSDLTSSDQPQCITPSTPPLPHTDLPPELKNTVDIDGVYQTLKQNPFGISSFPAFEDTVGPTTQKKPFQIHGLLRDSPRPPAGDAVSSPT